MAVTETWIASRMRSRPVGTAVSSDTAAAARGTAPRPRCAACGRRRVHARSGGARPPRRIGRPRRRPPPARRARRHPAARSARAARSASVTASAALRSDGIGGGRPDPGQPGQRLARCPASAPARSRNMRHRLGRPSLRRQQQAEVGARLDVVRTQARSRGDSARAPRSVRPSMLQQRAQIVVRLRVVGIDAAAPPRMPAIASFAPPARRQRDTRGCSASAPIAD